MTRVIALGVDVAKLPAQLAVTLHEGLAATAQRRVQLVDGRMVRDGVQG